MLPAVYNSVKTKLNEKIGKEIKGKTVCRRLGYSWEYWEDKDLAIPLCPVVWIGVCFYRKREQKEQCPWFCIDLAVTDGT